MQITLLKNTPNLIVSSFNFLVSENISLTTSVSILYDIYTMKTINISLPKSLSEQISYQVKIGNYASISEFIREGARKLLSGYPISFTSEAEEEILKISRQPKKDDLVFDSSKTPVSKMFAQLKKAKV